MICFSCKKEISIDGKVGFREDCMYCHADLHVCLNCGFYDQSSYNECRESTADRVVDKEKANYCEYFEAAIEGVSDAKNESDDAKKALEALFKK